MNSRVLLYDRANAVDRSNVDRSAPPLKKPCLEDDSFAQDDGYALVSAAAATGESEILASLLKDSARKDASKNDLLLSPHRKASQ